MLVAEPLLLGTWRPLPLMAMEVAGVALLVGLAFSSRALTGSSRAPGVVSGAAAGSLSRPLRAFLVLLFLLPLVQLLPVPLGLWAELPGRAFYAEGMGLAGGNHGGLDWRAISLIPSATEAAWLSLLPPLAVFLVVARLDKDRLRALVLVFLGIAAAEALLGLIQYGNALMGDSALGTYRNRNHLAGLLEMALPVGLALLAATVGHGEPRYLGGRFGSRKPTFRQWLARFSVARINQTAALGAVSMAILLGLVFTRSRAGVTLAMFGIVLCTVMFSYRLGGRNAYGLTGTFTAVGIGLASLVGLTPVWSRFAYSDPFEDARWTIFDATARAVGEFFPLGSGAGTFVDVLRRFHPASISGVTINRAHNDYLEWLLEFGLIAGVLIAAWLLLYVRQWGRVWKRGEWSELRFVQAGAGVALLLMMLHTLVDYNLRTPANAVFAAFMAAVFFYRPGNDERRGSGQRKRPEKNAQKPTAAREIPPENRLNPFGA
jgi:O-antigen ligase